MDNLIISDKDLSSVFKSESEARANPLVNGLREKLIEELHKLIEIALLKKNPKGVDKKLLEERLAQLTNPGHAGSAGKTTLNVIDAYLSNANSEALIK